MFLSIREVPKDANGNVFEIQCVMLKVQKIKKIVIC